MKKKDFFHSFIDEKPSVVFSYT